MPVKSQILNMAIEKSETVSCPLNMAHSNYCATPTPPHRKIIWYYYLAII